MDVNEKIVETWLREVKGMFTTTNLYFGRNNHDIDLLAVDLKTAVIWDCEVKFRKKGNGFCEADFDSIRNTRERADRIRQLLGKSPYPVERKFITTKSFLNLERNRKGWAPKFQKERIEVFYFDDIITDLAHHAEHLSKSTNEITQVLRLIADANLLVQAPEDLAAA